MTRKTLTAAATLLGLIVVTSPVFSYWHQHDEAGVELHAPDSWVVQPEDDTGLLVAENTDATLAIVLWVPDDTWDGSIAVLDTELETIIEFPSLDGDPADGTLNSMVAQRRSGIGTVDGETVQWQLTLVQGAKPVIALAFATPSAWSMHGQEAEVVVNTLRLLN